MTFPTSTFRIPQEVTFERFRQEAQWGQQDHPDGTGRPGDAYLAATARNRCKANTAATDNYRDILEEEVFEAFAEIDRAKLREELIQVAAVAVAWVECIDRRPDPVEETEAALLADLIPSLEAA